MTEDFIRIVKEEYPSWRKLQEQYISDQNQIIKKMNENIQRIHELLKDEKVREFAECIEYKEEKIMNYLEIDNSLYDFLKHEMCNYLFTEELLKDDNYPIYCYLRSHEPIINCITGKRISDYEDTYWNLQQPGYSFGPSDKKENGKNRELFRIKNADNIIYPPEGKSFFSDPELFYKVQAEFVGEAIRTDQEQAKRLILQKYRKR